MSIKTSFSIKDLESLSGIKAHTIRIWEKRYQLLSPNRSDTNIRNYDSIALRKLLNVVLLIDSGEKISKVSKLSEEEIFEEVRKVVSYSSEYTQEISNLKLSMMELDVDFFEKTYLELVNRLSVREIFIKVLVPFLQEIGVLWTTKTIKPLHEHFVSELIKQKIYYNISLAQSIPKVDSKVYALFLPMNEIHELAILYIHYELLNKGYNSIYFGRSLPMDDLLEIQKVYKKVVFVSYFTVEPREDNVVNYIDEISSRVLTKSSDELHLLGRNAKTVLDSKVSSNITVHEDIIEFVDNI